MISDGELLRRYLETGAESAFTELVQRHINIVYHAALRRVGGNAHAADDVAQRIFTDLARKAKSLRDRPNLAGWLYTSTRFAAADTVRAEQRRRVYEERAHAMHALDSPAPGEADRFEPFLDEVMDLLNEQDRDAVLLHFFEGRSFAEVGTTFSLSADAARMRVNRALERLRAAFAERGITSTAAALGTALSAQSALAAPAPLALSVAGHALSHAGAGAAVIPRLIQAAKLSPLITGAVTIVLLAIAGFALRPRPPAAAFATTNALRAPAVNAAQEPITESNTSTSNPSAPAAGSTLAAPISEGALANFSGAEKNILAILWSRQKSAPLTPGIRSTLRIGQQAPNFSGLVPLVKKRLIEQRADQGPVSLTPVGLTFCEAHRAEIEAHPVSANLRAAPDFAGLSAAEKDLLKMLWVQQVNTPPQPGVRVGLMIGPESLVFEACDPLLGHGLVALGPKTGMIYLTAAGRAYCEAHRPVLKAHAIFTLAGKSLSPVAP